MILVAGSILFAVNNAHAVAYPDSRVGMDTSEPALVQPGGDAGSLFECLGPSCGAPTFGYTSHTGCRFAPRDGMFQLRGMYSDIRLDDGLFQQLYPVWSDSNGFLGRSDYDIGVMFASEAPPLPSFGSDRSTLPPIDFRLIKGTMSLGQAGAAASGFGIPVPVETGTSWTAAFQGSGTWPSISGWDGMTDIGGLRYGRVTSSVINAMDRDSGLQFDPCRKPQVPTDPGYLREGRHGEGSWAQFAGDQWAIKRVGFDDSESSAWNMVGEASGEAVIAVIDTGLDWHHDDLDWDSLWRNDDEIPGNGIDDDRNGYVDDIIGWDFVGQGNRPWDYDGHGTVVTGIISAAHNDIGIAGINPDAKIMVLKALGNFGTTRASYLAEAIVYAADNGADIINLSVGGPLTSRMEASALEYAHEKGVLIVAAAGNDGIELDDYGPGGNESVVTVGATYFDDRTTAFSNFGERVDLTAPGVDVLSLRARFTDANYRPLQTDVYAMGTNIVGEKQDMVHASGTSFSAPIVTATASLMLMQEPGLTHNALRQRLLDTAEDVDYPGIDKYSGYGMLDARAALSVDADFSIDVKIDEISFIENESGGELQVLGTADADSFKRAWLQVGAGDEPARWVFAGQKRKLPIRGGVLGTIPLSQLGDADVWQVVVHVEHRNGVVRSHRRTIRLN